MKITSIISATILFLAISTSLYAVDCRTVEYDDHFEIVCTGDVDKSTTPPVQKAPQPESLPGAGILTDPLTGIAAAQLADSPTLDHEDSPAASPRSGRSRQSSQSEIQSAISERKRLILENQKR